MSLDLSAILYAAMAVQLVILLTVALVCLTVGALLYRAIARRARRRMSPAVPGHESDAASRGVPEPDPA